MLQTILELKEAGIKCVPLAYRNDNFVFPLYQSKYDTGFSNDEVKNLTSGGFDNAIAVFHSKANPTLICLDIDEKNAPGVGLFDKLKYLADDIILRKLYIEHTRSAGYHLFFLCDTLPPKKALASSPTGAEWIACRSAAHNCITFCAPTKGYTELQGCMTELSTLSYDEMMQLCDAASQLNQYDGYTANAVQKKDSVLSVARPPADLMPHFRVFDQSVDTEWMQEYLHDLNWKTDGLIKRKNVNGELWEFVRYWRPGKDLREPYSANLWLNKKRLSVFTASTELPAFDSGESFSHGPIALLYYTNNRDWKATYTKMHEICQAKAITLPQSIPMAYMLMVGRREVWKVDVKGIIDWAKRAGYRWLHLGTDTQTKILIRVSDNVIYEADHHDITQAYLSEVDNNYQEDGANKLLYNFMPSVKNFMDGLPSFDGNLIRDDASHAYIFFTNGALKITKDKHELVRYSDIDGCVFSRHIKEFDYRPATGHGSFGELITMLSVDEAHKAFIMSALGYILHYYKRRDYAKALMILEDVGDQEQARGRSGKGLIGQFVEWLRWTVQQDGRNFKSDSQFKLQQIVPGVQVYYLNDPAVNVYMTQFYNFITDGMLIESKGKKSYTIPYKDSPKVLITTNYLPPMESESDRDRFIQMSIKKVFGEKVSIRDVFPGVIFFDEKWAENDKYGAIKFAVDCLKLYLKNGVMDYQNEDMIRNANQRVIKTIVSDSIIECMEKAIETAKTVKSELKFEEEMREFDLRRDQPDSIKYAFGWEYGKLHICLSRFYQYCLKAYNLNTHTDKKFTKSVKLYISKSSIEEVETVRNNTTGRRITIAVGKISAPSEDDETNNVHWSDQSDDNDPPPF